MASRKTENHRKDNRRKIGRSKNMKKYCKKADITDRALISKSVHQCLADKLKRRDTLRLLSSVTILSPEQIYYLLYRGGRNAVDWCIERVTNDIHAEIIARNPKFPPIWYKKRKDSSSGKNREIGIQDVKQQIYDYVAVNALEPIGARIGVHQYASIKGRGPVRGMKKIYKWMRDKTLRYYGKFDVKKCFESISREKMMEFLSRYIKNDPLLWLVDTLLKTFQKGLSIGSYLSQFLCNLYMSQLYHEISERMYHIRKRRAGGTERVNLVKHVLFYMDDIYITGTNAKLLNMAAKRIVSYAAKMGITIKQEWTIQPCGVVDMMGFKIYRDHVTIRKRVWKRIRRVYMRTYRKIKTHKPIPLSTARRCLSYKGFFDNTNSFRTVAKYKVREVARVCKRRVSYADKSKVFRSTATC